MIRTYDYPIDIVDSPITLTIPIDGLFSSLHTVRGVPTLFIVAESPEGEVEEVEFLVTGNHVAVDDTKWEYVDTAVDPIHNLIWHLYTELVEDDIMDILSSVPVPVPDYFNFPKSGRVAI